MPSERCPYCRRPRTRLDTIAGGQACCYRGVLAARGAVVPSRTRPLAWTPAERAALTAAQQCGRGWPA